MRPQLALAAILAMTALVAAPAAAPAAEEKPLTGPECKQQFEACESDCNSKHPDDEIKRGACLPVCSARYAACDARAAYERAKPWLEDKAEKTKEYLEDLMKDPPEEKRTPPPELPDTTKT